MPMVVATITSPGTGSAECQGNGRMSAAVTRGRSADQGEGRAVVVEEPVVTWRGLERLARPGHPGPRPVRPG